MNLATTSGFISIVDESHTLVLPDSIPVGTKIAIFMIPSESATLSETNRQSRFANVMAAIRNAIADNFSAPEISDAELNERIKRARRAAKA